MFTLFFSFCSSVSSNQRSLRFSTWFFLFLFFPFSFFNSFSFLIFPCQVTRCDSREKKLFFLLDFVSPTSFVKVGSYLVVLGPCENCRRTNSRLYVDRAVTMSVVDPRMRMQHAPVGAEGGGAGAGANVRRHSAGDASSSSSSSAPEERYVNGRYGELRRNGSSASSSG